MNDNIINKIKKCLALSKSPNPGEAAAAMHKAQELMEKYQISMEEVQLSDVNEIRRKREKRKGIIAYEGVLANVIAEVFGCEIIANYGEIIFVGVSPNEQIAGYAWAALYPKMIKARKAYLSNLSKRYKRSNRTAMADNYALGWAFGVHKACEQLPKRPIPEVVSRYMTTKRGDLEERKSTNRQASTPKWKQNVAQNMGYSEGRKVQLGAGVETDAFSPKELSA